MIQINHSLKVKSEKYFVLPAMKKFIKSLGCKQQYEHSEAIDFIESYSLISPEAETTVINWTEKILKEGMKHVYIRNINGLNFDNVTTDVDLIKTEFHLEENNYIIKKNATPDLQLFSCTADHNQHLVSLSFSILLFHLDTKNQTRDKITYPIFMDIDYNKGLIIIRMKSKSNLFWITESDLTDENNRITIPKLADKITIQLISLLNLTTPINAIHDAELRKKFYELLNKYTFTPPEILTQIDSFNNFSEEYINNFMDFFELDRDKFLNKAINDIHIFVEKYLSISQTEKSIFTNGRDAFPIQFNATDREQSTIETSSSAKEPLQSKELYFDSKKTLEYNKVCDGLTLCYHRITAMYFNEFVTVNIKMKSGYCIIEFTNFAEEEDIQNVISSLFNS